jgi:2-oxoglutarate dehydrogenase E1 component
VAQPTTAGQYFHVLRRQMKRNFRKPLILMTPKSLLRLKEVASPVDDLVSGGFREIIDDDLDPDQVRRVLLCSGKVYYDLRSERFAADSWSAAPHETALIRVEQFYPFPDKQLGTTLARYHRAREWFWVQEESQNMGGWTFMEGRLRALGYGFEYIGRDASASPASGSHRVHGLEQQQLIEAAFREKHSFLVRATPDGRQLNIDRPTLTRK